MVTMVYIDKHIQVKAPFWDQDLTVSVVVIVVSTLKNVHFWEKTLVCVPKI